MQNRHAFVKLGNLALRLRVRRHRVKMLKLLLNVLHLPLSCRMRWHSLLVRRIATMRAAAWLAFVVRLLSRMRARDLRLLRRCTPGRLLLLLPRHRTGGAHVMRRLAWVLRMVLLLDRRSLRHARMMVRAIGLMLLYGRPRVIRLLRLLHMGPLRHLLVWPISSDRLRSGHSHAGHRMSP